MVIDGDNGFVAVDERTAPALLQPGTLSRAVNCTLEFADARPRWGVRQEPWGEVKRTETEQIPGGAVYGAGAGGWNGTYSLALAAGLYRWIRGNADIMVYGSRWITGDGNFQLDAAGTVTIYTSQVPGVAVTASIKAVEVGTVTPLALGRMNDPDTESYLVLITDEHRSDDGGWGRCWKISGSGSGPLEIPMNGFDCWGETRLVPARGALVMLRHGKPRWYWSKLDPPNWDAVNYTITLNTTEGMFTGDEMLVQYLAGSINKIAGTTYHIRVVSTGVIAFYPTRADAIADSNRIQIPEPFNGTRLYLERATPMSVAAQVNEGAPLPLVLESLHQGGGVIESYANGWASARTSVVAENTATEVEWRAGNHGFYPGQAVKPVADVDVFLAATTYHVNPIDSWRFTLHADVDDALTGTSPIATVGAGPFTGQWKPAGYSELPLPGGREGVQAFGRLILAVGKDGLAISDPADWLHFEPYTGAKTANLGEATEIQALVPLGENSLVVLKTDTILAIGGLDLTPSDWVLREISREYGCLAPRTAVQVGADVWFLSRRGVCSVGQTAEGLLQGVAQPVSEPMARTLARVDWAYASQAAAAWFNNRYLLAVPLSGQTGTRKNNAVLVYNFLNQAWEGYWEGDALDVVEFARLDVAGVPRLCFVASDGVVRYFDETALADSSGWITGEALSRGYTAGTLARKRWQELTVNLETYAPEYSFALVLPGVAEEQVVTTGKTLSRALSFLHGATRSAGERDAFAEDYSELAGGGMLAGDDVLGGEFQDVTERWPLRPGRDRLVQVKFSWSAGNVRWKSVAVEGETERALPRAQP